MMAPKVAVPIPPIAKAPNLSVRSPAPAVSATATVIRFLGVEKSTLFSTEIRPAIAAIKPNSTIDKPPMTGPGIERIRAHDVWVWPMAGITGCRNDDGNKREARPQIARYPSCDNDKENQRADARKQQCEVRIKTHDERPDNRPARHRDS